MFISISNEHLTIFNELDHMTKMSVQQTLNGSQALHASVVVVRCEDLDCGRCQGVSLYDQTWTP